MTANASEAPVKPAVVLCEWASDLGRDGVLQRLGIDMQPGSTVIAQTRASTGRPLLSNGFLGADIIHVPAGEGFSPHTHPGDHLLFVVGGIGTISASGEILETRPGQVYMVDGPTTHAVGAVTDHVLLSIGIKHQALDSMERQILRPFSELLSPEGVLCCRICGAVGANREDLQAAGCTHAPVRAC